MWKRGVVRIIVDPKVISRQKIRNADTDTHFAEDDMHIRATCAHTNGSTRTSFFSLKIANKHSRCFYLTSDLQNLNLRRGFTSTHQDSGKSGCFHQTRSHIRIHIYAPSKKNRHCYTEYEIITFKTEDVLWLSYPSQF